MFRITFKSWLLRTRAHTSTRQKNNHKAGNHKWWSCKELKREVCRVMHLQFCEGVRLTLQTTCMEPLRKFRQRIFTQQRLTYFNFCTRTNHGWILKCLQKKKQNRSITTKYQVLIFKISNNTISATDDVKLLRRAALLSLIRSKRIQTWGSNHCKRKLCLP